MDTALDSSLPLPANTNADAPQVIVIDSLESYYYHLAPLLEELLRQHYQQQQQQQPIVLDEMPIVCIDCEGSPNLSRHGYICTLYISISSSDPRQQQQQQYHIFLVDALAEECQVLLRDDGSLLKYMLQSPHVIKLIHDGRRDAEALYYQFDVTLQAVLDSYVLFQALESTPLLDIAPILVPPQEAAGLERDRSDARNMARGECEQIILQHLIKQPTWCACVLLGKLLAALCWAMPDDAMYISLANTKTIVFEYIRDHVLAVLLKPSPGVSGPGGGGGNSNSTHMKKKKKQHAQAQSIARNAITAIAHLISFNAHVRYDEMTIDALAQIAKSVADQFQSQPHDMGAPALRYFKSALADCVQRHLERINLDGAARTHVKQQLYEQLCRSNALFCQRLVHHDVLQREELPSDEMRYLLDTRLPLSSHHHHSQPEAYSPQESGDIDRDKLLRPLFNDISLVRLLATVVGVDYSSKHLRTAAVRSNPSYWRTRPFSEDMLSGASGDVLHLRTAYETMRGLLAWFGPDDGSILRELLHRSTLFAHSFRASIEKEFVENAEENQLHQYIGELRRVLSISSVSDESESQASYLETEQLSNLEQQLFEMRDRQGRKPLDLRYHVVHLRELLPVESIEHYEVPEIVLLVIMSNKLGILIGKSGKQLAKARSSLPGPSVATSGQNLPPANSLMIVGSLPSIEVMQKLLPREKSIQVPASAVGRLVGRMGSHIADMERYFQLDRIRVYSADGGPTATFVLCGDYYSTSAAATHILCLVEHYSRGNAPYSAAHQ